MNLKDSCKLEAFVGGYTGNSYELVIDFGSMQAEYIILEYGYTPSEKYSIDFSEEDLEQFLLALDEIKLLHWKESYVDHGVLDGTSWSVKLYFHNSTFESSGTNAYPKKWSQFCEILEKLTGQTFR